MALVIRISGIKYYADGNVTTSETYQKDYCCNSFSDESPTSWSSIASLSYILHPLMVSNINKITLEYTTINDSATRYGKITVTGYETEP